MASKQGRVRCSGVAAVSEIRPAATAAFSEFLNWETTAWQGVARKGTGFLHAEDVQNLVGEEDEEEEAALDINFV